MNECGKPVIPVPVIISSNSEFNPEYSANLLIMERIKTTVTEIISGFPVLTKLCILLFIPPTTKVYINNRYCRSG